MICIVSKQDDSGVVKKMRWNQFIAPTPLNLIITIYIYFHSLSKSKNLKSKLPIYLLNSYRYDTY